MDKMTMETPDMVQKNIDKLLELFPNCATEITDKDVADGKVKRGVDFTRLKQMLSSAIQPGREHYGFDWVGKKAAIVEANKPIRKTLRPCKEESKDWDTTQNLYIEGDNLEALKILQESYLGKVKMIYIDPPYNTGDDFIYSDDFRTSQKEEDKASGIVDDSGNRMEKNTENSGRYHSKWCSMIYSRLLIAKNLLADDGVIFISIDDGELNTLRMICNEVFGEKNFRNTILTRRRTKSLNAQFASKGLYSMNVGYEYILVYARGRSFIMNALKTKKEDASPKGRWDVFWSNADRPTMRYELLGFTPKTGQWRNSKERADIAVNNYKKYEEEFSDKMTLEEYSAKTGITDFIRRIPNGVGKNGGVQHWVAPSDKMLRTSNWTDIEVSQIGKEINLPFSNPKNKTLIEELINSNFAHGKWPMCLIESACWPQKISTSCTLT